MANRYSVLLKYLVNLNSHSNFKFECKIKFIAVTYIHFYKLFGAATIYTFWLLVICYTDVWEKVVAAILAKFSEKHPWLE